MSDGKRFDKDVFDGLASIVGPTVLDSIVGKFETELAARFAGLDATVDTSRLAKDAHAMVSSAGMLGFVGLIAILRRLEANDAAAQLDGLLFELSTELRLVAADLAREKSGLQARAA